VPSRRLVSGTEFRYFRVELDFGEGKMIARSMREESPNSAGQVWFLTGTGSDPRESATEKIPQACGNASL